MCLLNGDIGGNLFANHDFGKEWTIHKDGSATKKDILVKDIIREAVHTYGQEPYSNIMINDLDTAAVELTTFRAKGSHLYIYQIKTENERYLTQILFGDVTAFNELPEKDINNTWMDFQNQKVKLLKRCNYGDTVGYKYTDLTYVGDLIVSVGGTITSMLDSVVKMLGEFEYFYDVDGRFVFQRKKIYYNIAWSNAVITENEKYFNSAAETSADSYVFNRGLLIESFQNKPAVNAIKNDFSIWGTRPGTNANIPIHIRYAIDDKPKKYEPIDDTNNVYVAYDYDTSNDIELQTSGKKTIRCDWRHLIYLMARDNLVKHGAIESLKSELSAGQLASENLEQWNERKQKLEDKIIKEEREYETTFNTGYDAYYADMLSFWPQLYRRNRSVEYEYNSDGTLNTYDDDAKADEVATDVIDEKEWEEWHNNNYWNPAYIECIYEQEKNNYSIVFTHPEMLTFWIDFLDIPDYKVSVIGRRPKAINDSDVKALFYKEVPLVAFTSNDDNNHYMTNELGYDEVHIPEIYKSYFSISSQGKSAKDTLDNLVYQCTYYQEQITLSCIPIYYLQPNTRIRVTDEHTGIDGDYLIKSMSFQLSHDGMMSITATKAAERIL